MVRAILVRQTGGPEVLRLEDVAVPAPGPGEIRVRNRAVGLNFIDTYQRSGLYKVPLPFVAGNEGAGEVLAVGEGVTAFRTGDRVGYAGPVGAYAEERVLPATKAVQLPDSISFETAAASLLKGTTAYYLLHLTFEVKPGDTLLIHAAAGGTGQILVQWAKAIGARVIATAGGRDKVALARAAGADVVIDYRSTDFVQGVRLATEGRGVDVVYDGVGQATFEGSLDCLRPRGLMVSFGNASGPVSIPRLGILAEKGSLYVTRPTSASYFASPGSLQEAAAALFNVIALGRVSVPVAHRWALADAAEAHRALEARETSGAGLLIV